MNATTSTSPSSFERAVLRRVRIDLKREARFNRMMKADLQSLVDSVSFSGGFCRLSGDAIDRETRCWAPY